MDQREELARLITGTVFNQAGQTMGSVWQPWTVATVADAILAAGWEKRSLEGEAGWGLICEAPRDGTVLILGNREAVFIDCYAFSSDEPDEWRNCLGNDALTHFQYPPRPVTDEVEG